jgi:hypothetical protein
MLQLRDAVQVVVLDLDSRFDHHHLAHSAPDPTQGCGARNLELREQVGIASSGDLRFDPMVIGTAFAVGHQANYATTVSIGRGVCTKTLMISRHAIAPPRLRNVERRSCARSGNPNPAVMPTYAAIPSHKFTVAH